MDISRITSQKKIVFLCTMVVIIVFYFLKTGSNQVIKIGFVADFTGKSSQMGIQARNGALMAVDQINRFGGIHGRPLELVAKDNKNSEAICRRAVSDLTEMNVPVIIGPLLSKMAKTVIEVTKDSQILVISPSVGTDDVVGIDDHFLRINSSARQEGRRLASLIIKQNIRTVGLIVARENMEYTSSVARGVKETLTGSKTQIVFDLILKDEKENPATIKQIKRLRPGALVLIANGKDTANLLQQMAKQVRLPVLYGCQWSMVTKIHNFGGKIVEGMRFVGQFRNLPPTKEEVLFDDNYKNRFVIQPNFASVYAYEAVMIFAKGVDKAGLKWTVEDVKTQIVMLDSFKGVSESFRLDTNGDAVRQSSYYIIKENIYQIDHEKN